MNDELAIEAQGLHKRFGAVHALDDVSLTVPAGTLNGTATDAEQANRTAAAGATT
jgi:ABC-type sugar transport system ATPase subunit